MQRNIIGIAIMNVMIQYTSKSLTDVYRCTWNNQIFHDLNWANAEIHKPQSTNLIIVHLAQDKQQIYKSES